MTSFKYYLYSISSKWNADKKRSQKITGKILGKITQEGFVPSSKDGLRRSLATGPDLSGVYFRPPDQIEIETT